MMKQLLLFMAITVAACNVSGQTPWTARRDSMLNVLSRSREDTNKVLTMLWLGVGYADNRPDSATWYAKALIKLSWKLHFPVGTVNGLSLQAMILSNLDKQDQGIEMDKEAIDIAKKAGLRRMLANLYNNMAIIYTAKGDMDETLDLYLKAAAIFEQANDSPSMAFIYSNIASVYNDLKEYKNAYTYSLRGIMLCRRLHQTHGFGAGMVNLSSALIDFKRYDTALVILYQTKEFARRMDDRNEEVDVMANMDYAFVGLGKYDLIKPNALELMSIAKSVDNKTGICYALIGLTEYFLYKKDYAKARHYAHQAVETADTDQLVATLKDAYGEAGTVELADGNVERYNYYNTLKDSVDDVLSSDKILKNTQELETKYALNKKQAEIDDLNKQKKIQQLILKQRRTVNWVMAALVLIAVLIGFMYNRNYRQKKKLLLADAMLQQQRITELEREKQLMAAQAVLQGQVEERTRLAKDLHDGLGSILSSAKYSFTNMKENIIITPENAAAFERSMGMLDKSINELRRVAHNMMPEALMKFGLDTALRDFCNSIDQSGVIQLTYQSFEMDEASIPGTTAAGVYRIIQELVNNVLKHAGASKALVQLIRKGSALSITVEDNGKGFDRSILRDNNGMGYHNLQNRVTYLNGTMDIQTGEGKGTSVNIEIPNITI
jgi:two-component system NarL family sensor kinase